MKTFLFIDGTNLYAGQYELFGPKRYLNFPKFIQSIQKRQKVRFNKVYFYASYSPKPKRVTGKTKQYLINEFLFYKSVKQLTNLYFFKGDRSKTSGKEKGVDIALCTDLLTLSHNNKYDKAIIFTGDADFNYALKAVNQNKQVEVYCLENRVAFPLSYSFNTTVITLSELPKRSHKNKKAKIKFVKINPTCSDVG